MTALLFPNGCPILEKSSRRDCHRERSRKHRSSCGNCLFLGSGTGSRIASGNAERRCVSYGESQSRTKDSTRKKKKSPLLLKKRGFAPIYSASTKQNHRS